MRVLVTTTPAYGHFHPLVPLARALVASGHEALVATGATMRPAVEAAGLTHAEAGSATIPIEVRQQVRAAQGNWQDRSSLAQRLLPLGVLARAMTPDALRLTDTWRPDVIVRDNAEYGGYLAAELRGLPHVTSGAVWFRPPWLHDVIADSLATLRAEVGLPPDPTAASLARYLVLAPIPPSWVAPDEVVPPTAHFIRPEPFNAAGNEVLPERVSRLPVDRPTVHASLGTVFNHTRDVFEAILEGLSAEPVNLVLTVGHDRDPAEFGPQPEHIAIERYIPHDLLLPHCDLVVTHAGLNTILACLDAGLPMVTVPLGGDQHRNAQRLADLGAAVTIQPEQRDPAAFRDAATRVLAEPSYRHRVEQIQAEMHALPGWEHAVALLERVAREREPIIAA